MHAGFNIYTPTFEKVSGSDARLDLQDLKLINSEGWGTETIWVLNDDGTQVTGETFTWQCSDMSGLEEDGWINDSGELADVKITEGDGFYISCDADGVDLQVAGGVKLGKFIHTMHAGFNLVGNFCPATINIQGLKLVNTDGWGTETIWELNDDGTQVTGTTYTWQNADMSGLDVDGWVNDSGELADLDLPAGQGLYLSCDAADVDVEIDAVLVK